MRLRVLDFGAVSPLRSQAIYHGLAHALAADDAPILALCTPTAPCLCVGAHQDIDAELDTDYCAARGLPILRREVGGGAVYLDARQLFYQFVFPRACAPRSPQDIFPFFIAPIVQSYRTLGIDAAFYPPNDIGVGARRLGGTGAGTVGAATVFVGSFLFDFDREAMANALRVPSAGFRRAYADALRRYLVTVNELAPSLTQADARTALLTTLAQYDAWAPVDDHPRAAEMTAIEAWETEPDATGWVRAPRRRVANGVKIVARTYLTETTCILNGERATLRLVSRDGVAAQMEIESPLLPAHMLAQASEQLCGVALQATALVDALEKSGLSREPATAITRALLEAAPAAEI